MLKKIIGKIGRTTINIIILCIFIFPFLWMVITSLKTLGQSLKLPPSLIVSDPQWENFATAFNAIPFMDMLKNSLITSFGILFCQAITVIPAAYAFAQYDFKGKKYLFGLTLITMMIPAQLIFLPVFLTLSKWGLINSYASIILPSATSAFAIFMLRQTFMQVPKELIESARLDGASELKIIRKIMLPIVKPTIITLGLINFIATWNDYFWPFVLTTNNAVRTLPVGIASLKMVEGGLNYPIVMAGNVLLVIPILIIFAFSQKQIVSALSYTGVK